MFLALGAAALLSAPLAYAQDSGSDDGLAGHLKTVRDLVLLAQHESIEAKQNMELALERVEKAIEMVKRAAELVGKAQDQAQELREQMAGLKG
ncbi:MAG: hypothetical protein IIA40_09910 [SAR324 cluster bacterium]|nr:hypothetical protein [SAR324 cluster bacterium]